MFDRVRAAVAIYLLCAGSAHAGIQLFEGSWVVKAFGNERTGGTGESEFYSALGLPFGQQCNSHQPRCPYESTPTDGEGFFAPLGGSLYEALYCAPWLNWGGVSTTMRPPRDPLHCGTQRGGFGVLTHGPMSICLTPPRYRNPIFFTPSGNPNTAHCDPRSTSLDGYGSLGGAPGIAQAGSPIEGQGIANTKPTLSNPRSISIAAALATTESGIRGTRTGDLPFEVTAPYRYTYAKLRNAKGLFGPGLGPGSFSLPYQEAGVTVARVKVKQAAAKFGGTMRMLGRMHTKVCYYRIGGCSLGINDWHYDAIGAAANTDGMGVVTQGYLALGSAVLFNTWLGQFSTVVVEGSRFPWTTGSVTVTAVGRGAHKTLHYGMGYDNRTPTSGKGTIQLVSPALTRWLLPGASDDTGGIAILRIKFVPEPNAWVMLAVGMGFLAYARKLRR